MDTIERTQATSYKHMVLPECIYTCTYQHKLTLAALPSGGDAHDGCHGAVCGTGVYGPYLTTGTPVPGLGAACKPGCGKAAKGAIACTGGNTICGSTGAGSAGAARSGAACPAAPALTARGAFVSRGCCGTATSCRGAGSPSSPSSGAGALRVFLLSYLPAFAFFRFCLAL
mmetsp:Transcript_46105/g.128237  ORF Transcript_46105/g.128237 Transcript_46105/m.128237 type:complete len:171 (+) Transcript_46105:1-513(+)